MPRSKRQTISQTCGSYHIISKVTDGTPLFNDDEKNYFFKLLYRLAKGFYVRIHSYCVMGNHFHILATGMELDAKKATETELIKRYRNIYGKDADPPTGSYASNGEIIPDPDGGIERLRNRLGDISRFVQELKQCFSRWYNNKHKRKGYLWSDRYKGVLIYHGVGELICSSYIDLNPVRAGIVTIPEEYNWSSLSLRVQNPQLSYKLLFPIDPIDAYARSDNDYELTYPTVITEMHELAWYLMFVYISGGIDREGKSHIPKSIVESALKCSKSLKITGILQNGINNFSKGRVIGFSKSVMKIQIAENRKRISPRYFIDTCWAGTTRVLRI